jgi:hypothetical protein
VIGLIGEFGDYGELFRPHDLLRATNRSSNSGSYVPQPFKAVSNAVEGVAQVLDDPGA